MKFFKGETNTNKNQESIYNEVCTSFLGTKSKNKSTYGACFKNRVAVMSASACACICAHESLYLYVYPESSIAFTRQTTKILPFIVLQKYKKQMLYNGRASL